MTKGSLKHLNHIKYKVLTNFLVFVQCEQYFNLSIMAQRENKDIYVLFMFKCTGVLQNKVYPNFLEF